MLLTVAQAEPLVTLQTDAQSVLKISTEGNQLAIEIDGTKLRFPLADEATSISAATLSSRQANRLLLRGLETQLLYGGKQKEVGLLAEAFRLAPDDARVAYWYARSLVNAGSGKAAQEVLAAHRDAIAAAYPGLSKRLAEQIERRVHLESLPVKLVRAIDKINASVGGSAPFFADKEPRAAYFRLVDQHEQPIEASAFQISCNGQNERRQSFERGYYLFTYLHHRSSNISPCELRVSQSGLQRKTFEFTGAAEGVADAGTFQVKRMGEEDRRPVVVKVVDAQGEPLAGVTVTFNSSNNRRRSERNLTFKTDEQGHVETRIFPDNYSCYASLTNYNRASQSFEIEPDSLSPNTLKLKLYRLMKASVKIKWRGKIIGNPNLTLSPNDPVSTGEIELHNGVQSHPYSSVPWVRLLQKDDQLQLQFTEQTHYGPPGLVGGSWIGRVDTSAGSGVDSGVDFEAIDLTKLEEWKEKVKQLRPNIPDLPGRHQPVTVAAEEGAIFVGKILSRDRNGRYPQLLDFKILVAQRSDAQQDESAELDASGDQEEKK
ncbi:MAG: hypothetical protein GXP24_09090 [Planctomycetes bacterium]|nr:hypothetical protein [Planctomycetota bacterium]